MNSVSIQSLLFLLIGFHSGFSDKPKLERGKHGYVLPVRSEGLSVHNIFQSGMVMPRDTPIRIWGWSHPGEEVTVTFGGHSGKFVTGENRKWVVTLPAQPASSEAKTMIVESPNSRLSFEDILLGDVWVAGGQSNMQHPLSRVEGGSMEIESANFKGIRLLTVPSIFSNVMVDNFPIVHRAEGGRHVREGFWDPCSPANASSFSAIAYIFARRLHIASEVPIGIIDASRWGTTVETWTPLPALRSLETPSVKASLSEWDKRVADYTPENALKNRVANYNARTENMRKHGRDVSHRKAPTEIPLSPLFNANHPGNGFASMIAPLGGFPIKGAIFHQGFNNSRADADTFYHSVMSAMIPAWRKNFENPEMAFGIISLCTDSAPQTLDNFNESMENMGIYVREAQYKTFLDFYNAGDKNIGFASTYDLRRAWYHPQHKIPAGERIASWALNTQYSKSIQWKPPMIIKMEVLDDRLQLHFDLEVASLESLPIEGFAISGEDRIFHPATAEALTVGKDNRGRVKHNRKVLVLSSPHVPKPIHYRYAWARNPMGNLRAGQVHQRECVLATQRSDNWGARDLPYVSLEGNEEPRELAQKVRAAYRLIDLVRGVKDAEAELKQRRKLLEEEISKNSETSPAN